MKWTNMSSCQSYIQTTCTIFYFLANPSVFCLHLVLCVKVSNLDLKWFLWAVWAHIQTKCTIFKILANEAVVQSFRTLRKQSETGETDLLNFDWNQSAISAGIRGFTECPEGRLWRHTISSLWHFQLVLSTFSIMRKIIRFEFQGVSLGRLGSYSNRVHDF